MNVGITEFEEKIVRRLLQWEIFILQSKVQKECNNPCAWPSAKIYRIDKNIGLYGVECGKYKKKYCISQAFVQVMNDIENGRISLSDTDPSLRIPYAKSYEAYKG